MRSCFVAGLLVLALAGCRDAGAPVKRPVQQPPAAGPAPPPELEGGAVDQPGQPAGGAPKAPVVTAQPAMAAVNVNVPYDPATEITVRGPITGFLRVPLPGNRTGLLARISAGGALPYAYLGPDQWLSLHDIRPQLSEQLVVTGSRTTSGGQTVLLARTFVLNGLEIQVRDEDGKPFWPDPSAADSNRNEEPPRANRTR